MTNGNLFNKYESKNPIIRWAMKKFFQDMDKLLLPLKEEINSVLEIGCGEGYISDHLSQLGFFVEGADISNEVIEHAKQKFPKINFFTVDIYEIDSLGRKWDLVVCSEVLEHLSDPVLALIKLRNVAGKYILVTVPNEPFFRIANILRLKYLRNLGNTPGHINHWSYWSFKKLLISLGFRDIVIKISTVWLIALIKNNYKQDIVFRF